MMFLKNLILLLPPDSHEDNADVDVQAVDRTGEPSVHIDVSDIKVKTASGRTEISSYMVSEGILANQSKRDHHRALAVHSGGTVVMRQCARDIIPFPRTPTTQLLL